MKKILSIFTLLSLLFVFNACKQDEEVYYEGETLLHFDKTEQEAMVTINKGNADYLITYGVTKASQADNNVELVFNAAKSTAVLGTDFTIVRGTDVLKGGAALGDFKINLKETAAKAGKVAYFNIKSGSIANAAFNQEVEVKFALVCPPDTFDGMFTVKNVLFGTFDVEIVPGTAPNTFILKDYIETGYDIVINYDPTTGEVTIPATPQSTGYVNGANGVIMIKPAVDASKGKIDFCNRTMNLRLSYGTPGGATYTSGGATSYADVFTGY